MVRAPTPESDLERLRQSARALEAIFLKQLVVASKAFTGGDGAGSAVRADMFADALADAMVKGGGIGLAAQLERSLMPDRGVVEPPSPLLTRALDTASSRTSAPPLTSPLPSASTGGDPTTPRVTSPFGMRHDPFDGRLTRHDGVDLAAEEGTAIRAVAGGVVRSSGERGGYGRTVEIDHGNGVTTLYAHASELLVRDGDSVTQGQPIARVGNSGRSTGSHLHFELRQDGRALDPIRALKIYRARVEE